jgi:ribosomal protein L37AE/L43A
MESRKCPRCSVGELGEFTLTVDGEQKLVWQCDECSSQFYDPETQGTIERYKEDPEEMDDGE